MAILKMKHLRLMLMKNQKDELLRKLIRLGCVQFSEIEGVEEHPEYAGLLSGLNTSLSTCRNRQSTLNGAIAVIDNSREASYGYDQRVEAFGRKGQVAVSNDSASDAVPIDAFAMTRKQNLN